jgi:hypothetical protein
MIRRFFAGASGNLSESERKTVFVSGLAGGNRRPHDHCQRTRSSRLERRNARGRVSHVRTSGYFQVKTGQHN